MSPDAHAPLVVPPVASAGRRAWAALEPMHNYLYFVPMAADVFGEAGVTDRRFAYYAARACALGEVGPLPVVATFYNFSPAALHWAFPRVWEQISAEDAQAARVTAVDRSLRQVLKDAVDSAELLEAVELARTAAEAAVAVPQGRPLFAAHAQLPWPQLPHAQLWHAQTLLREFRGDGHTATLLTLGVSGLEALILFTATEKVDGDQLRLTRGWQRNEWSEASAGLVHKGLLEPGSEPEVTEAGRLLRERIEAATDIAAQPAYEALGVEGCDRLAELSTSLNQPVVAADVIPWLRSRTVGTRRSRVRTRLAERAAG